MISGSNNLVQTILGKALAMYGYWLGEAVDIVCIEVGHYWLRHSPLYPYPKSYTLNSYYCLIMPQCAIRFHFLPYIFPSKNQTTNLLRHETFNNGFIARFVEPRTLGANVLPQ